MRTVRLGVAVIIVLIIASSLQSVQANGTIASENTLQRGPYIDSVVYRVINDPSERLLALQSEMIDMDSSFIDPNSLSLLEADPGIAISQSPGNGYRQFTINCRDYPLNISGLRRAFAFAFDKTRVISEAVDGFSQEHDSVVPTTSSWCIEKQFDLHYYRSQVEIGNAILNGLGFDIDPVTGHRNAPNGQPFDIEIEYSTSCMCINNTESIICQIGVDAFTALHIDAHKKTSVYSDYMSRLDGHGNYDIILTSSSFQSNDVDWLAYQYWSEYANTTYENPTNFRNATYDKCRNQLLRGTTYNEVYNASSWMQRILQDEVPILVLYENIYLQGYRIDRYSGYVEDLANYITGPWTMRKIHQVDGTQGGTVAIAISEPPMNFNIFRTTYPCPAFILENLWPSLYDSDPDLNPIPDLAERMLTETHADNPAVSEGNIRYTIDIIHNATWSDGIPLTAEDVAFTFTYALESGAYGNPASEKLNGLIAVYTPSSYRVVLDFMTISYWCFSKFAYTPIIPEHIFNNDSGIGFENWNTWNPILNPEDPFVTCGPFLFSSYRNGEYYELVKNPLFHYRLEETNTTETNTTSYTETIDYGILGISIAISSVSGVVIIIFSYFSYLELKKSRPNLKQIHWDEVWNRIDAHGDW